jgi:hypothetical protein
VLGLIDKLIDDFNRTREGDRRAASGRPMPPEGDGGSQKPSTGFLRPYAYAGGAHQAQAARSGFSDFSVQATIIWSTV